MRLIFAGPFVDSFLWILRVPGWQLTEASIYRNEEPRKMHNGFQNGGHQFFSLKLNLLLILTRTCRARQGAPKAFARTGMHPITTRNDFPVSTIRDFRQFPSRRWRKLRIYIRFDENQKDSLILSCLSHTNHPTNFACPPHFEFLHGGERLGFSAIPVVVVVVVIYLSIYLCSGIL